jgi:hypothetical protein
MKNMRTLKAISCAIIVAATAVPSVGQPFGYPLPPLPNVFMSFRPAAPTLTIFSTFDNMCAVLHSQEAPYIGYIYFGSDGSIGVSSTSCYDAIQVYEKAKAPTYFRTRLM